MKVIFKRLEDVNIFERPGIIEQMAEWFDGITERDVEFHDVHNDFYLYRDYLINRKWFTKVNDFDEIMKMFEL